MLLCRKKSLPLPRQAISGYARSCLIVFVEKRNALRSCISILPWILIMLGILVCHGLEVSTQREMKVETVLQSLTAQSDQAATGIYRTALGFEDLENA